MLDSEIGAVRPVQPAAGLGVGAALIRKERLEPILDLECRRTVEPAFERSPKCDTRTRERCDAKTKGVLEPTHECPACCGDCNTFLRHRRFERRQPCLVANAFAQEARTLAQCVVVSRDPPCMIRIGAIDEPIEEMPPATRTF